MVVEQVAQFIVVMSFMGFAVKRLMNYLHALQQDDYDNARLLTWVRKNTVYDTRVSIALILVGVLSILPIVPSFIISVALFFVFVAAAFFEHDPRKDSKKSLVLTQRARRILGASLICTVVFALLFSNAHSPSRGW